MKKLILITLTLLCATAVTQAQILISVANATPNGVLSGGTGSGNGVLTSSSGSIASDVGLPLTSYTVSNLDLTSLGGGATESFTFTVTYTATTDGSTAGTPRFNGFGNVAVAGGAENNHVDGSETLTATIALTSTTFVDLSLSGFTALRVGGVALGEVGTFSWAGGSQNVGLNSEEIALDPLDGITEATLSVANPMNFQKFDAQFVAVPEPSTYVLSFGLLALGVILYRRRLK